MVFKSTQIMVIQSGLLVSVMVSSGFAGNGDGLLAIAVLLLGLLMKKDAQDRKAWIHIIARKCMELLAAINPKLQSEGYFKIFQESLKMVKKKNRISLVITQLSCPEKQVKQEKKRSHKTERICRFLLLLDDLLKALEKAQI
jgi:hypothetical protein